MSFLARMKQATELVRSGHTSEAARLIQSVLGQSTSSLDGDGSNHEPSRKYSQPPAQSGNSVLADPTAQPARPRRPLGEVVDLLGRLRLPDLARLPQRKPQVTEPIPSGASFISLSFACDAGSRNYKLYAPSCADGSPRPLVVMLHGCTQDPDDFAAGTGMNALAEELNVLVAYPEQPASANQLKCWNWFNPRDQSRGQGEPAIIAGIVKQIVIERHADPARVYVVGLSAGGAMAAVLGETYPDVFAGVGVHSGLPFRAASDVPSAFAAMKNPGTKVASTGGDSNRSSRKPRMIVFHGDADTTVHPNNGVRLYADARGSTVRLEANEGVVRGGRKFSVSKALSAKGEAVAEFWVVHGAHHAWSGGRSVGSYTDPQGPDASREMMRFFLAEAPATR
jgi:poly(hydroxyalkanoate) depolymerase family esterase